MLLSDNGVDHADHRDRAARDVTDDRAVGQRALQPLQVSKVGGYVLACQTTGTTVR